MVVILIWITLGITLALGRIAGKEPPWARS